MISVSGKLTPHAFTATTTCPLPARSESISSITSVSGIPYSLHNTAFIYDSSCFFVHLSLFASSYHVNCSLSNCHEDRHKAPLPLVPTKMCRTVILSARIPGSIRHRKHHLAYRESHACVVTGEVSPSATPHLSLHTSTSSEAPQALRSPIKKPAWPSNLFI